MKKILKKIFPTYFKLKDGFINESDIGLTDEQLVDLAFYYVIGKLSIVIVVLSILFYEILKDLYQYILK